MANPSAFSGRGGDRCGKVITDDALAEVRRPHVWSDSSAYRVTARSYVDGARPDGREPHDQVVRRFEQAVVRHAAAAAERW